MFRSGATIASVNLPGVRRYSFYDNLTVTRMLPLERAVWWTKFLREVVSLKPLVHATPVPISHML